MLWKRPRLNNRLDATTRTPLSTDARNPKGPRRLIEQESFPLYNDKNLTCADCGQEFVFTASEQDFYSQRGFTEPRRCASCRASRKAARNADGGGGYSSVAAARRRRLLQRRRQLRRRQGGGGDDRGPREMFTATCSSCGKEASVPFRPTSGKPVYCSDCFRSQRGYHRTRLRPSDGRANRSTDPGCQSTRVVRFPVRSPTPRPTPARARLSASTCRGGP